MREEGKEAYRRSLLDGNLSRKSLDELLDFIRHMGMRLEKIPEELFKQKGVKRVLKGHDQSVCYGNRSWEGLVIGFPGTRRELSTKNVGTPYLRMILYPILDLYGRLQRHSARAMPLFIG